MFELEGVEQVAVFVMVYKLKLHSVINSGY